MTTEAQPEIRASFHPKHLARLMPFKAKSDIRYYLNGMCIERAEKGVYVIATDGHTLAIVHDAEGTLEGADSVIINVTPELAVAAKRARPVGGIQPMVRLKGTRVRIALDFDAQDAGELFVQAGNSLVPGKFPNWRTVLPDFAKLKRGACAGAGTVQARYLGRLEKVLNPAQYGGVTLWQENPDRVIVCQLTDVPELLVLIMPMRGESDEKQRVLFAPFAAPRPASIFEHPKEATQADIEAVPA